MNHSDPVFIDLTTQILARGSSARFRVSGGSMYPLIRNGEAVEVEPVDISHVRCADIIFYRSPDGKMFIHRVVGRKMIDNEAALITKGDSSSSCDGCVDRRGLLGRVTAIEKYNGTLRIDKGARRYLNICYAATLPFSKWIYLFMLAPSSIFKKRSSHTPVEGEKEYYKNSARNIAIYEEAKTLVGSLRERGIQTIMLKGIFLAEHVYKNIALRPMTDIDILIKKEDLPQVSEALGYLGYPAPGHYRDFLNNKRASSINSIMYFAEDPRRPSVHIHWHIVNSTWPLEELASGIDMERIRTLARETTVGGVKTLALAPEHLLIYLAHHGLQHSFDKPAMVSDITETIKFYDKDIDWGLLKKEAEIFGLSYAVYVALAFVSRISGINIPQLETLRPARMTLLGKSIASFARRGKCDYGMSYLTYLYLQREFPGKVRYILKTVFPSRLVLAHNLRIPVSQIRPSDYYSRITGRAS